MMERDGKQSFEKETEGFPTANSEVRLKEVEVRVNGLDREVGVMKEQMAHLATRDEMIEKFAEVKSEIAQLRAENREGIAQLRAENAELKAMIAQSEARMFKMLAMQTTIIVAAFVGVLISPLLQ